MGSDRMNFSSSSLKVPCALLFQVLSLLLLFREPSLAQGGLSECLSVNAPEVAGKNSLKEDWYERGEEVISGESLGEEKGIGNKRAYGEEGMNDPGSGRHGALMDTGEKEEGTLGRLGRLMNEAEILSEEKKVARLRLELAELAAREAREKEKVRLSRESPGSFEGSFEGGGKGGKKDGKKEGGRADVVLFTDVKKTVGEKKASGDVGETLASKTLTPSLQTVRVHAVFGETSLPVAELIAGGRVVRVREGEDFLGEKVLRIRRDGVTLEKEGRRRLLPFERDVFE
ncbi:MAG: hypothetical protein K5657_07835 [Desulfovibrio sp.]|nr:hypothetical protein [Desulfovibrio sp.]